jgi:hypothetical protein
VRFALAVLLLSCGDDPTAGAPDAPAHSADAAADAPAAPLPPDLAPCRADLPCPDGTDCLPVYWLGGERRCLRPCTHTADCGRDEVCYGEVSAAYDAMADHCYTSVCQYPLMTCQLGAEIDLPPTEQRAGTCLPVDDLGQAEDTDGGVTLNPLGQCRESGSAQLGELCPRTPSASLGVPCAPLLACVGDPTDELGRCATLCDPDGADPCLPGSACFDASEGRTVYDPASGAVLGQIHATWGYCRSGTRCMVTESGGCPSGQGCLPTTPVRASGFCSERGGGARALGQSCVPTGAVAPSFAERCASGRCDPTGGDADAGLFGICRAYCDPMHPCAIGSCVEYSWDDLSSEPNLTQGFGVCR